MPSFDASCSVVSTVASRSRRLNSVQMSCLEISRVVVPGIGMAMQMPSGDVRVDFKDGSALTVRFFASYLSYKTQFYFIINIKTSHL